MANAYGVPAFVAPFANVDDLQGLRTAARRAKLLGFRGQVAIHASQVSVIESVFALRKEQITQPSQKEPPNTPEQTLFTLASS